ncbi:MAG: Bcr/CflA family efflux MFS transporter [Pseudomonadota bacterium]
MRPVTSPPELTTLILLTALSTLTLNMFLPSLATMAEDFQASYSTVSLAIAGYLAVTALVQLIVGPMSDRLGRRPVVLVATAIFALASVACALAEDVWIFLTFRMLQGAIISGYVLSLAIVRDTTPERQAAGLIGYISMAMALAPMLGPMLGGLLDTVLGWRASFWFYGISGALLFALCWLDLGETRRPSSDDAAVQRSGLRVLAGLPAFWAPALCTAFSTGAFYIFLAGAPLVATAVFEVTTAMLGVYIGSITIGFLVGSFVAGRLAPRYRLSTMMLAGRLIACAGLLVGLWIVWSGVVSPLTFFGSTIFVGVGNGVTMPSSNSAAMSAVPRLAGAAAGLSGALTVGGGATLTYLVGVTLTRATSPEALIALMLVASLAGLASAVWARRLEEAAASGPRPATASSS